jgi:hypothetical protein
VRNNVLLGRGVIVHLKEEYKRMDSFINNSLMNGDPNNMKWNEEEFLGNDGKNTVE